MALDPELLLLRDDGEEEFAGAKLEDSEVRSVASNQSEMEFSSLQDMPKELDPSAVLPLDCLLAFVFFDANWCGYLHRRDLERILLTLGIRLSAEQAKQLVSRVVTQNICQYRSLQYSRQEGLDGGLPEEVLFGNLDLLPPSGKSTKPGAAPTEHKALVSHNGSLINVGSLLQRAEQQDSGRLYLENKIHTLELKLEESHNRFSATEVTNKTLAAEMQELRARLAEAEETARMAERQKSQLQRLLQELRRRLTPCSWRSSGWWKRLTAGWRKRSRHLATDGLTQNCHPVRAAVALGKVGALAVPESSGSETWEPGQGWLTPCSASRGRQAIRLGAVLYGMDV